MYQPRSPLFAIKISHGLMINAGVLFALDLKQEAHLRWTRDCFRVNWEEFVRCQVKVNQTYSEAMHQLSVRNMDVLTNVRPS